MNLIEVKRKKKMRKKHHMIDRLSVLFLCDRRNLDIHEELEPIQEIDESKIRCGDLNFKIAESERIQIRNI